jgi:hypothetical protein
LDGFATDVASVCNVATAMNEFIEDDIMQWLGLVEEEEWVSTCHEHGRLQDGRDDWHGSESCKTIVLAEGQESTIIWNE